MSIIISFIAAVYACVSVKMLYDLYPPNDSEKWIDAYEQLTDEEKEYIDNSPITPWISYITILIFHVLIFASLVSLACII